MGNYFEMSEQTVLTMVPTRCNKLEEGEIVVLSTSSDEHIWYGAGSERVELKGNKGNFSNLSMDEVKKSKHFFYVRSPLMKGKVDGSQFYSFECVGKPGYYLRHAGFNLHAHRNNGSELFSMDASWCFRNSDKSQYFTTSKIINSINYPSHFLSCQYGGVRIETDRRDTWSILRSQTLEDEKYRKEYEDHQKKEEEEGFEPKYVDFPLEDGEIVRFENLGNRDIKLGYLKSQISIHGKQTTELISINFQSSSDEDLEKYYETRFFARNNIYKGKEGYAFSPITNDGKPCKMILRHRNFELHFDPLEENPTELFQNDSTWIIRKGHRTSDIMKRLSAINYPLHFIKAESEVDAKEVIMEYMKDSQKEDYCWVIKRNPKTYMMDLKGRLEYLEETMLEEDHDFQIVLGGGQESVKLCKFLVFLL